MSPGGLRGLTEGQPDLHQLLFRRHAGISTPDERGSFLSMTIFDLVPAR